MGDIRKPFRRPPRWAALLAVAAAAGACARQEQQVFIPLQKAAIDQYQYALDTEARNELVLRSADRYPRLLRARETVRQAFLRVVEGFPEDRQVTPLARLKLAEIECSLDIAQYKASNGEIKKAIADLERIQADYPENDYIQAKARFDQGVCWKKLKDYERAQQLFHDVEETYADHKDDGIKRIVYYAHQYYQKTYVK